jgi:hypothetical protein
MDDPNSMQVGLDVDQNCPISGAHSGVSACRSDPDPASLSAEPGAGQGVHNATNQRTRGGWTMGRGLLLWLIGIPLPIILVIWLFGGLS